MFLITITLALILVGFAAFVYGTIALSKFAFRVSTGRGIAALLFPPYTLYFTFSELEEEEKDIPAASWVFGFLVTALLVTVFSGPLGHLANGRWDKLQATSPGQAASDKYGSNDKEDDGDEESSDDSAAADESSDDSDSADGDESDSAADEEDGKESEGAAEEGESGESADESSGEESGAEEGDGENAADEETSGDESGGE